MEIPIDTAVEMQECHLKKGLVVPYTYTGFYIGITAIASGGKKLVSGLSWTIFRLQNKTEGLLCTKIYKVLEQVSWA